MKVVVASFNFVKSTLRNPVPAYAWFAIVVFLLGLAVLIGFSYPAHMYPGDSDPIHTGLCGLDVLHGQFRLFYPRALRISSQHCYVAAGLFYLFGVSREALSGTSIFYGILFLIFIWTALKEAAGGAAAVIGLVIAAIPPLQVLLVTYPPGPYSDIMAFSACTVWLGLRLMDISKPHKQLEYLLFGVSLGFAFWTSQQTLMVSVPVLGMLIFLRAIPGRAIAPMVAGGAICLLPYVLLIAYLGIGPLENFTNRPVSSFEQLRANVTYLIQYVIPMLFFTREQNQLSVMTLNGLRALIMLTAPLVALFVVFSLNGRDTGTNTRLRQSLTLAFLIAVFSGVSFAVSGAGSVRGWTVRYMIPLCLVPPFLFTICFAAIRNVTGRVAIVAVVAFLAIAHSTEYPFLKEAARRQRSQEWATNKTLVSWLNSKHCQVAIGDYWTVYHLNFDTGLSVRAIPIRATEDYLGFGERFRSSARAVLLDRDKSHLTSWVQNVGLKGTVEQLSDSLFGYIIDAPIDLVELDLIRSAGL